MRVFSLKKYGGYTKSIGKMEQNSKSLQSF